jgi:hypothetical protein
VGDERELTETEGNEGRGVRSRKEKEKKRVYVQ